MSAREWRNRMNCYQGMYQKRRLATWMASNRNLSDYNGAHPKILGESPPSFSPATEEGLLLFGRILVGPNPSIHLYVCFFFFFFLSGLEWWTWATIQTTDKHQPSPAKSSPSALPKVYCLADSSCMAACDASRLCLPACVCVCVSYSILCLLCFPCVPVFHAVFGVVVFFISKEGEKTMRRGRERDETCIHARTYMTE